MASLIYNSFWDDLGKGNINPDTDTINAMLVTSTYAEDKDTHTKRSDVTNEVSGTGYSTGGVTVSVSVTKDTATDKIEYVFAATTLTNTSITGIRKAVYYKSRGGASSADELIAVADYGADTTTSSQDFQIPQARIIIQN